MYRLRKVYKAYPRIFWTFVVVMFIDAVGGSLLLPFFALYVTHRFGATMTQVGLLFACFAVAGFVGSLIGGALADRIGRKAMLLVSLLASSISALVMGLVGTLETFLGLTLLVGIFTDIGKPAYQAMVADMLPEDQRTGGYGILRVVINLSVVIGPAIGGFLASRSYLLLFSADAAISLLSALIVLAVIPETKPEIDRTQAGPEQKPIQNSLASFKGYLIIFKDRAFMPFVAATFVMVLVYTNMNTSLGVYLRDVHGVPESGYGWLISLNAVMVVLFQFPITRRLENLAPMPVMAVGAFLVAAGFAMYAWIGSYALFMLAMAVITIGEMVVVPVSQAVTARLARPDMRGRYMAIYGFAWSLPIAITPLLAGLVMDNANPVWLWLACGVVGTASALFFMALHRQALFQNRNSGVIDA